MNEHDERLAVRGPRGHPGRQGNQGNRGEQGAPGLSIPVRRALVFLFILNVALAGANMLWTAHLVQAGNRDRCAYILADAAIPLPSAGPSREWEAAFEADARTHAARLGCKQGDHGA